jgi:hypothetical protein
MRTVSQSSYKGHRKAVRDAAKAVADVRASGLRKIAARRNRIVREDACSAYMEARFWLKTYRDRLAEVQPAAEKHPEWSPAARARNHIV